MDLNKKTTILFSTELHKHLADVARRRGLSLGELIRQTCVDRYGSKASEDRLEAVEELAKLTLDTSEPATMRWQSLAEGPTL